jgi:hypothetical protein
MATNIYKISNGQKDVLIDSVNPYIVFDPIKDVNENYLISANEFNLINNLEICPIELVFIKSLTPSIYEPKPQTNLFE